MIAAALALTAGLGMFYLFTALAMGWRTWSIAPSAARPQRARRSASQWMTQAGLDDVAPAEFVAVVGAIAAVGAALGYGVFGGIAPPLAVGAFAGSLPVASYRKRRHHNLALAHEAWPRLIEEIRLLTSALGRSVPQALFEVGRRGPEELRVAFAAAEREWLISTDFARTVEVLKARLADPTADVTLETLLVAHEVGGSSLDGRLLALADDRLHDVQGRKDARARQAGARFARMFVLVVPLGMALVGLRLGSGRSAYQSGTGQALVVVALGALALCWAWAGHLMKLPNARRVFADRAVRP